MPSSQRSSDPLVIDAGPVLALARIDALHLPARLFAHALLPQPVFAECVARPERADAQGVKRAVESGVIQLADVPGGNTPPAVAGLGSGEVAVIRLSLERHAVALLDDKAARRAALNAGLRVIGVVGLLRLAKRERQLLAVRPGLEALVRSSYFLAADLVADTLRAEGE